MRITTQCQCRGADKLYTLIELDEAPNGLLLTAFTIDDKPLPSNLVRLSDREYVIVLADLNVKQIVSLVDRSVTGEEEVHREEIHPRVFAIASKINGRIKKEQCDRIRNIDFSGKDCLNKITCELLSFTPHGQILVGRISGIKQSKCASIAVLNDRGEMIGRPETTLFSAESLDSNIFDYEVKIFRTEEDHGLVIAGIDDSGEFTGGFYCLKEDAMRELIKKSVKYFMTAFEDPEYCEWVGLRRLNRIEAEEQRIQCKDVSNGPTFSIIVPLYNTPLTLFDDMLDSVIAQTYPFWELILVNSTPENTELSNHAEKRSSNYDRIKLLTLDKNYGITENTNKGIEASSGDYICFFDHDDTIEPDLLYEYYKAILANTSTTMLYCDEDKLFNRQLVDPSLKPDFSIDLLRSNNYLCHMLCVSRDAYESVEPQDSSLDGAQDHALALKVAELEGHVEHVSKVLYHWRITPNSTATTSNAKPYASRSGIKAVKHHLGRIGVEADVGLDHQRPFRYRTYFHIPDDLMVSIIIPIVHSTISISDYVGKIREDTDFNNYEILLVGCKEVLGQFSKHVGLNSNDSIRIVTLPGKPNPAQLMNAGANSATGSTFIFLKEGYLPAEEQWINDFTGHTLRDDVGIVGTMTTSPNGLIMQAGLTFTDSDIIQLSKNLGYGERGYTGYPVSVRDVSLLGSDCIAMSRKAFEHFSGFDDSYSTYYSVYDICFKSIEDGLWNVYTPHSRVMPMLVGGSLWIEDHANAYSYEDKERLFETWERITKKEDPFFNTAFSRDPHYAETYKLNKRVLM